MPQRYESVQSIDITKRVSNFQKNHYVTLGWPLTNEEIIVNEIRLEIFQQAVSIIRRTSSFIVYAVVISLLRSNTCNMLK